MKRYTILWVISLVTLFIVGCSKEDKVEQESNASEKNEKTAVEESKEVEMEEAVEQEELIEVEPLPSTFEELENLTVGKYAGEIYLFSDGPIAEEDEILEKFSELPNIKGDPTKLEIENFYRELLYLVQEDYYGPDQLLKEMQFQSMGDPEIEDTRYQFKENLNIEVLVDASGSMAQEVDGQQKMDAAKKAITTFLAGLPEEANVALRVYGHKGTGSDSDKALSCGSSELIYGFEPYQASAIESALSTIKPAGWTPNGLALQKAQEDLTEFKGENNTNIVYLVSDGIETCESDPVGVANAFYDSDITPIINVLGFDVDGEGQNHLREIADASEGIYQTVADENELAKELEKVTNIAEAWEAWKKQSANELDYQETDNSLDIFSYVTDMSLTRSQEKSAITEVNNTLLDNGFMTIDTYHELDKINSDYHKWIDDEIESLKEELYDFNEKSYQEAKQALEEKYQLNAE